MLIKYVPADGKTIDIAVGKQLVKFENGVGDVPDGEVERLLTIPGYERVEPNANKGEMPSSDQQSTGEDGENPAGDDEGAKTPEGDAEKATGTVKSKGKKGKK